MNVGTLRHFAGMTGTGNVRPGVTLSTGTVMGLAVMAQEPAPRATAGSPCTTASCRIIRTSCPGRRIRRCQSGVVPPTCMPETGYDEMNRVLLPSAAARIR